MLIPSACRHLPIGAGSPTRWSNYLRYMRHDQAGLVLAFQNVALFCILVLVKREVSRNAG